MLKRIAFLAILLFAVHCSLSTVSAVPAHLSYQGILRDSSGNLVTGTKSMTFKIYDAVTGGSEKASFGPTSITASNGQYTAQLGPISSPATVFDGNDRWLEIAIDGTALSPRLKINSVAYAIRADYATTAESAGTATTATTANGLSSSATINLSGSSSGNIISTTNSGSGNALYINGRLGGLTALGNGPVSGFTGKATVEVADGYADISNNYVTNNSIILVTPTRQLTSTMEVLSITGITSNSFRVWALGGNKISNRIPFNYLIIN